MTKNILIISFVSAVAFYLYYYFTGDERALAPELLALLVSFTCSMLLLTKK